MGGTEARMVGATLLAVLACLLGQVPTPAAAATGEPRAPVLPATPGLRESGWRSTVGQPNPREPRRACPRGACEAIVEPPATASPSPAGRRFSLPGGGPLLEGGGEEGGLDPQDLRSAYAIPASGGSGQTIALIGALGYKRAEADLAAYRARYGLPPCTKKGHCLRRVNQRGGKSRSHKGSAGWEVESALDLDMVSAACPECHILLVDAEGEAKAEFAEAVDTAVRLGASEVSNSYGWPQAECGAPCAQAAGSYEHAGVMIFAAAGDKGFDNYLEGAASPTFPADLPAVVAVGGTSLTRASNARGWSESAWWEPARGLGTGSGCAAGPAAAKPLWQADLGCAARTTDDVAAVAACATPVSVYASSEGGWMNVCGTSVSAPLLAGIEAHAGVYVHSLPGADAFYAAGPAAFFDVTAGDDGECPPGEEAEYLCAAGAGYDGPSGLGTPDGPLDLTAAPPLARTEAAALTSASNATLGAMVGPQGLDTAYSFEYGPSTSYGQATAEVSAGAGSAAQAVSATASSLQPGVTYHYRVLARNAAGVSFGQDRSFRTATPRVSGVQPASGPTDGGGEVTITGANFAGVTAVRFGTREAEFEVSSETRIVATAPPGIGAVDVRVSTAAGTSPAEAADGFAYALGPVLAWGLDAGRLGRGFGGLESPVPVEVAGAGEAVSLAAGGGQSLAVLGSGEVLAWGQSSSGEAGDGATLEVDAPRAVCAPGAQAPCPDGPYLTDAVAVAAGAHHSLALLSDGTVVAWGADNSGQLGGGAGGHASPTPIPVCTAVESPCAAAHVLREATAVAAGWATSYALLRDGTVVAWGRGEEGELGDGASAASATPVPVTGLGEVAAIAAGGFHALALRSDGTVRSWGWNRYGQLGDGSTVESPTPVPVCAQARRGACLEALDGVGAIAAGEGDSYALRRGTGTVLAWGWNEHGELADGALSGPGTCKSPEGATPCGRLPAPVPGLSEVRAIAAGVGLTDTLVLRANGELLAWGPESAGDLGAGSAPPGPGSAVPVHVCPAYASEPCAGGPYLSGEVGAIAAGGEHDLVSFAGAR